MDNLARFELPQTFRVNSEQALCGNRDKSWKKTENKRKSHGLLAILLVIFLVFASINGFLKTYQAGKAIAKSQWDGAASFVLSLGDKNNSIFVFQKEPRRAIVVSLGGNTSENSQERNKSLTIAYGAPIENFIEMGNNLESVQEVKKKYEEFVSLTTPIKILTTGWGDEGTSTNISRIDAFKLWWQLKSLGADNLSFADLSDSGSREVNGDGKKVLAANSEELSREIAPYMENVKIVEEDIEVDIVNSSGETKAARLAASFVNIVGGSVGSVTGDTNSVPRCTILQSENSYTASYLEKIFDCDIKDAPLDGSERKITLTLGSEFAERWFREQ